MAGGRVARVRSSAAGFTRAHEPRDAPFRRTRGPPADEADAQAARFVGKNEIKARSGDGTKPARMRRRAKRALFRRDGSFGWEHAHLTQETAEGFARAVRAARSVLWLMIYPGRRFRVLNGVSRGIGCGLNERLEAW